MGADCCKFSDVGESVVQLGFSHQEGDPKHLFLSDKDRDLIVDSWKKMIDKNKIASLGVKVFHLVLLHQQAKQLFSYGELAGEKLKNHLRFKEHAYGFAHSVAAVVGQLENSVADHIGQHTVVTKPLSHTVVSDGRNGSAEKQVFLKDIHPTVAVESYLKVWREELGDHWTPEVEKAWKKLLNAVVTHESPPTTGLSPITAVANDKTGNSWTIGADDEDRPSASQNKTVANEGEQLAAWYSPRHLIDEVESAVGVVTSHLGSGSQRTSDVDNTINNGSSKPVDDHKSQSQTSDDSHQAEEAKQAKTRQLVYMHFLTTK